MRGRYTFKAGDIVTVNIQVENDPGYGLWIVLRHRARNFPDGMLEEVDCLSPLGTVVTWSPQYLTWVDQKV